MTVSGNTFVSAIVAQLRKVASFSGYKIYTEAQIQGVVRPCFFIEEYLVTQEQQLAENYRRSYRWQLTWLPALDSNRPLAECRETAELLRGSFNLFPVEDSYVRPTHLESEIVEGKVTRELVFTIDADIFVEVKPEEHEKMQVLHQSEFIKDTERGD